MMKKFNILFIVILVLSVLYTGCDRCGLGSIEGTVTDIEGNVYKTITIGKQEWMAENLKTTTYRDGTDIEFPDTDDEAWENNTDGAYSWHSNDIANKDTYGALYNWYAATNSSGLCPEDWHVPSDEEWQTLVDYLGGDENAGGALKATQTEPDPHPRWNSPNNDATNCSGFSAFPGGLRRSNGSFREVGLYGAWWTTTDGEAEDAWHRSVYHLNTTVYHFVYGEASGMSVRCIRD